MIGSSDDEIFKNRRQKQNSKTVKSSKTDKTDSISQTSQIKSKEKSKLSKKTHRNKNLEDLFEDSSYEASSDVQVVQKGPNVDTDHIDDMDDDLLEIFGNGEEYLYVLNKVEEDQDFEYSEKTEIKESEEVEIKIDDLIEYTKQVYDCSEDVIKLLHEGYSPSFICLHGNFQNSDFFTTFCVKNHLSDYKRFLKVKQKCIEGIDEFNTEKYWQVGQLEDLLCFHKTFMSTEFESYIIRPEQLIENISFKKNIYKVENLDFFDGNFDEIFIEKYSKKVSIHPDFKIFAEEYYKNNNSLENIENEILKYFGENCDAIKKIYLQIANEIVKNTDKSVYKGKSELKMLYDDVFNYVYNSTLTRPIEGVNIGVIVNDDRISVLKIFDFERNEIGKMNVDLNLIHKISEFTNFHNPVCIAILSNSTNGRHLFESLKENLPENNIFFVDGYLIDKSDLHNLHSNIASSLMIPEVFYLKNLRFISDALSKKFKNVVAHKRTEFIKNALLSSLAIKGIDLNYVITNQDIKYIIESLGFNKRLRIFRFTFLNSLSQAKRLFYKNKCTESNFFTYFRIFKDTYATEETFKSLDSTLIHPKLYDSAKNLCKKIFEESKSSTENYEIGNIISDKEKIKKYYNENVGLTDSEKLILKHLMVEIPVFDGINDKQLFRCLINFNKKYLGVPLKGVVRKVAKNVIFVETKLEDKNYTIFVHKDDSNLKREGERVIVKVTELSEKFISLRGEFVRKNGFSTVKSHENFRNYTLPSAKSFLNSDAAKKKNIRYVIRVNELKNYISFVIRFTDKSFKVIKINSSSYMTVDNLTYEDVDDFIKSYIEKMLKILEEIKKHKNYFPNEDMAREYVKNYNNHTNPYSFYFSIQKQGYLVMNFGKECKKIYIYVGRKLKIENKEFESLEAFIDFIKAI